MTLFLTILIGGGLIFALIYTRRSHRVGFLKALENSDVFHIQKLISKGFDLNAPLANGARPIVMAALYEEAEMVELLLENGADGSDGLALHSAAMNGNVEIAEILLKHNADINGVDIEHEMRTPLMVSALFNKTEMQDFLLKNGADEQCVDNAGKKWAELLNSAE